jgi:hypothetical protein
MKKIWISLLITASLAALTACGPGANVNLDDETNSNIQFTLPGQNPVLDRPGENGRVAGFGTGLWHGLISVVTLVLSFFDPDVQMYEVHNNGPLYNLGFLGGAILVVAVLGFAGGRRL